MALDKMLDQFKDLNDLKAFAQAQQKTLIELTKKNKAQEDEIKHLKKLLEGAVPVIQGPKIDFSTNDEETIAREQLYRLKDMSHDRELTLEETRRVEIYAKILIALKDKPKTIEIQTRAMSIQELTAAANAEEKDDGRPDDQH